MVECTSCGVKRATAAAREPTMAGLFRSLGKVFTRKPDEMTKLSISECPAPPPESPPPIEAAPVALPPKPAATPTGKAANEAMLEAVQEQSQKLQALLEETQGLVKTSRQTAETLRNAMTAKVEPDASHEDLVEKAEEIRSELQRMLELTETRGQLFEKMYAELSAANCNNALSSGSLDRLAVALEQFQRAHAAHVELMEQVRDRLAGSNDEFVETFNHQSRRVMSLLIVVVVLLAILAFVTVKKFVF